MTEFERSYEHDPIALWYVSHTTPYGGAPEEIKRQWVGVPLPVRQSHIANEADIVAGYSIGANIGDPTDIVVRYPEESVNVNALDAFKALRLAGRDSAAEWWEDWFSTKGYMMGDVLRFLAVEGRLMTPAEIEAEFPDANQFDDLE